MFSSCSSAPEPQEALPPAPEPVPVEEPFVEPEALDMDWAGTSWILKDSDKGRYPGYRGFHLAADGRLLTVGEPLATGDSWKADGNRLRLSLLEGEAGLPMDGEFMVFPAGEEDGIISAIRLVPADTPRVEGVLLIRARAKVDVVENHWIPKYLDRGNTVQWPMSREIHMILLPDARGGLGILGYGGENRFRSTVRLGTGVFSSGPISVSRRQGPATPFENLYLEQISKTNRYVQIGDDLFLYRDTRLTAAFRVRLFD